MAVNDGSVTTDIYQRPVIRNWVSCPPLRINALGQ